MSSLITNLDAVINTTDDPSEQAIVDGLERTNITVGDPNTHN
jgi:hypothetical protein